MMYKALLGKKNMAWIVHRKLKDMYRRLDDPRATKVKLHGCTVIAEDRDALEAIANKLGVKYTIEEIV